MSYTTLIFIVLAGIIALLLALFQYWNKSKRNSKRNWLFIFLRFITLFGILLLIINPKFESLEVNTEKPNLLIAVDNSSSIKHLNQSDSALNTLEAISNNPELTNKFNITAYSFGSDLSNIDSLSFDNKQTNISQALSQLSQIYKETTAPIILITDGNQTYGSDYELNSKSVTQPVYPIILGDTVTYTDLKIQQLNVNKYAYLKNSFPIEVFLVYNGEESINSRFVVTKNNNTVYSQTVSFNKENNSKVLNFTLPANNVGVSTYKAVLTPLDTEKNKINNVKNFAVEVIDQKTKVAAVSDFVHPDLGALKKSIESNEQREVAFLTPNESINQINDFQLFILYQPNIRFNNLIEALNKENKNRLVVLGPKTDLRFFNSVNQSYSQAITNDTEDYQGAINLNYTPFSINDIDFESFPPLKSNYGEVAFNIPYETILYKKINSIITEEPLFATFETSGRREAVLFAENIWQWRSQSYLDNNSFNNFDDFIGKVIQYLASNKKRNRLNVDYESFYNGNGNVIIKAQIFNQNYEFDNRETLTITLKDNITEETKSFPFVLKNNNFQVDLSNLPPSEYSFTVKADNENISQSGNFQVLEYDVEQQFLNANVTKLQSLATNSQGKSYFVTNTSDLANDLLEDNRFQAIQKSNKTTIPLIDWKYLLILIALSLTIEWFLRKYNGLI
ncbi:VWA domain-containing protein [Flavobacteriaceae bacterium XHP0103]|uniref:VWA domain-containing protein n=1 Tax=Marixanthotalea marina TaxID=2844359 RepID=UPI002989F46F|nr:VWA domain-containing protein [Marixanthotalea marina]MBU3822257.1 VWA domain-containing protein [Marixanthotalea marina]